MGSPDKLAILWEQAIADENWDLAVSYEEQRAQTAELPVSSGIEEQRAILSSELYWFGGIADHGVGLDGPRDIM